MSDAPAYSLLLARVIVREARPYLAEQAFDFALSTDIRLLDWDVTAGLACWHDTLEKLDAETEAANPSDAEIAAAETQGQLAELEHLVFRDGLASDDDSGRAQIKVVADGDSSVGIPYHSWLEVAPTHELVARGTLELVAQLREACAALQSAYGEGYDPKQRASAIVLGSRYAAQAEAHAAIAEALKTAESHDALVVSLGEAEAPPATAPDLFTEGDPRP